MSCPPGTPATLTLDGVSWGDGILYPVSMQLGAGRVLGVLGANGAGKSTLLRLIYRYNRPNTGRVLIDGEDVHRLPARRVAQRVAAVLQEQPSDFALTVTEIVALGRAPHRRALAGPSARDLHLVDHALERLNLGAFARRSFGTLSGGERQRVMVARALAQEPGLIVLDEPTNHLDIRHQHAVLDLARSLGRTVLAALHDLNLAAQYCDHVIVLDHGSVVAAGSPDDVFVEEILAPVFGVHVDRVRHPRTGTTQILFSPLTPTTKGTP